MEPLPTLDEALRALGDVYVHSGPIEPPADERLIQLAERPRGTKALLFICTYGGLANVAYRMIRCLRHAYQDVTVVIAGPCKSAGTLLALGADELVMTGNAELGPLDVQILKENELIARQSGLAPSSTFDFLTQEACKAFQSAYLSMKFGGRLSSASAAETAARLTVGMFAPLFSQIDPIRVGETTMANLVAHKYALALLEHEGNQRSNTSPETIARLVTGYPAHDYVIDRQEARTLFNQVRAPNAQERVLIAKFSRVLASPSDKLLLERFGTPSTTDHANEDPGPTGEAAPTPTPVDGLPG
ncbi:hypothetical protein L6R46_03925 [Myxococcota bacterium]|nr:hypothetical protein [Myxococcota bacterium]